MALAIRLTVIGAVSVVWAGELFRDDATYLNMAADVASGTTDNWGSYTQSLFWNTATFLLPLTALFKVFSPAAWIGQVFVAGLGSATAGLTTRLADEASISRTWALAAGLIVALLPSQVLWSSVVLKDGGVWALLVAIGIMVAVASRSTGRRLLLVGLAAVVLMVLLRYLRVETLVVAAWAVAVAAWFGKKSRRLVRGTGAALILILLPIALGMGPAGLGIVLDAGSFEQRRAKSAENASTAFVPTREELAEGAQPEEAGTDNGGEGRTPDGHLGGRITGEVRHLPRGLSVMLLYPYPWTSTSNLRVKLAQLETIIWYPLLALAIVGLASVRRYPHVLLYPLLVGGGMSVAYAMSEGNFGTAYRHRGEFVWVVALLAAFGARRVFLWWHERDSVREPAPER